MFLHILIYNPTSGLYIFRVQTRQRFFRLEALGLFLLLGVRQQQQTPWDAAQHAMAGRL